jgi:hypothetical protein
MLHLAPLLLFTVGSPAPSACEVPSAPLVVRSVGLGQVESLDASCDRALVSTESGASIVSGEGVAASTRAVMLPSQAQAVLDVLRTPEATAQEGTEGLFTDRSLELMDRGGPLAQGEFLRELYATGAATDAQAEAILAWEGQLLGEVAYVLGLDREALVAEMRLRHRRG